MAENSRYYHVTTPECAAAILSEGFWGGFGDNGHGVYLYDNANAAAEYAISGGWDGSLKQAVVLELVTDQADVYPIDVDPHWPNPEDYESVCLHPTSEDDEVPWRPHSVGIVDAKRFEGTAGFKNSPLDCVHEELAPELTI